jgi:hypothetical protein
VASTSRVCVTHPTCLCGSISFSRQTLFYLLYTLYTIHASSQSCSDEPLLCSFYIYRAHGPLLCIITDMFDFPTMHAAVYSGSRLHCFFSKNRSYDPRATNVFKYTVLHRDTNMVFLKLRRVTQRVQLLQRSCQITVFVCFLSPLRLIVSKGPSCISFLS